MPWGEDKYKGMIAFQMAREISHLKIAEMLIEKSIEFFIKLNTKDHWGMKAFHRACENC